MIEEQLTITNSLLEQILNHIELQKQTTEALEPSNAPSKKTATIDLDTLRDHLSLLANKKGNLAVRAIFDDLNVDNLKKLKQEDYAKVYQVTTEKLAE